MDHPLAELLSQKRRVNPLFSQGQFGGGSPILLRTSVFPSIDVIVKSRNKTVKKKDPDARRANPEE